MTCNKEAKIGSDILKWANEKGEFVRKPSTFRDAVTRHGRSGFEPESGRYHLYVSYACPWAHRTIIYRKLKGLEGAISMDVVDYHMGENGWRFNPAVEGATPDTANGFSYLKEVYFLTDSEYSGRYTVPVLFDKKKKTNVNNDSSEIIRILNGEFTEFCATPAQQALDLYPSARRAKIDELNEK